ncbi:hypothetical protein BDC45DRAFT_513136 [Circinella umbellata]|nr:hypothetical protein BDC45DRAFT_513136 [Circinella umbellata]
MLSLIFLFMIPYIHDNIFISYSPITKFMHLFIPFIIITNIFLFYTYFSILLSLTFLSLYTLNIRYSCSITFTHLDDIIIIIFSILYSILM